MQLLLLFVTLACLWLLLSGLFTPLMIGLGLLSCVLVITIAVRMELVGSAAYPNRIKIMGLLRYLMWLSYQIVMSNVDVSRRILMGRSAISPTVVRVPSTQRSRLAQVIYANSITLTPGTVSINVRDNEIRVHALTRESARSLLRGEMDRRVSDLEVR